MLLRQRPDHTREPSHSTPAVCSQDGFLEAAQGARRAGISEFSAHRADDQLTTPAGTSCAPLDRPASGARPPACQKLPHSRHVGLHKRNACFQCPAERRVLYVGHPRQGPDGREQQPLLPGGMSGLGKRPRHSLEPGSGLPTIFGWGRAAVTGPGRGRHNGPKRAVKRLARSGVQATEVDVRGEQDRLPTLLVKFSVPAGLASRFRRPHRRPPLPIPKRAPDGCSPDRGWTGAIHLVACPG